MLTTVL